MTNQAPISEPNLSTAPSTAPIKPRRRTRLGVILLTAITTPIALVTMLGLERLSILPDPVNGTFSTISRFLLDIVAVTVAVAVVIGIINLLRVHMSNLRSRGGAYSFVTIIVMLAILILHAFERVGILKIGDNSAPLVTLTLMESVQVAIESALAGLLFFTLVYSAYRLMRRRLTIWNAIFIAALIVVLIGTQPISGLDLVATLREWLLRVPVNAGTRGLLIGVAIGTVMVGIRVLIGQERTLRE